MGVKKYCIIVAGGSGRRMKSALPKQFLLLEGKPLLMHTIERFHSFDSTIEIIVVLPPEHHSLWESLVKEYSFSISHTVAAGGEERFHSVRAGLELVRQSGRDAAHDEVRAPAHDDTWAPAPHETRLPEQDEVRAPAHDEVRAPAHDEARAPADPPGHVTGEPLVAVHDGVRPLVSHDTIWRCYADAEEFGTAIPFIEPSDSVRIIDGDESRPLPRNEVRLIQTPQVFLSSLIMNAYDRPFDPSFTDDATVAEAAGVKIHLTHGNRENIKITTPEDLAVAHTLIRMLKQ
ncbi:MAG: 2-C-methyl-D-erythritol 4-phosphate cytidylyltransferase [Bacteroidales bacterium]|nr:2-C-methyl-D-erythritol 4-phosphate cytidylyltransferase [Bacteroidales bacterium]